MAVFEQSRRGNRTLFIYMTPKTSRGRGQPGAPVDAVYDGDTIRTIFPGTQNLRFLGCDTAELAYRVPTSPTSFKNSQSISGALWGTYLDDPLREGAWPRFPESEFATAGKALHPLVADRLRSATGIGCAANHARHGENARLALTAIMKQDQDAIGIPDEDFGVFAALSHEVLDSYGRPLVFLNTDVADPALRPRLTYNERMIENGQASPLFIWPNVDPFRGKPSVTDAALPPGKLRAQAKTGKLGASRLAAAAARQQGLGIHDPADPLRLLPFELRILGDRKLPSRWVVDLSAADDDPRLYPPEGYPLIVNPEDRLYVPQEYVPLFAAHGWRPGILIGDGTA